MYLLIQRKKIALVDRTKRQARLYKLTKANQIDTLKSLGVTPSILFNTSIYHGEIE